MRQGITWYDILGVLPGASPGEIREAYDDKAGVLRPELVSGAPSNVVAAVARGQAFLDTAWRVLGDPGNRARYDRQTGILVEGGGLGGPENSPTGSGYRSSDFGFVAGRAGAEALGAFMALTDWLAPHPAPPRRVPVPDVRGLFYTVCLGMVGRLSLRITPVMLTPHPMPVDGLVVDQSPRPPAKLHRAGELTVRVWHPSAR